MAQSLVPLGIVMSAKISDRFNQVKTVFSNYLEEQKLRSTTERMTVLEEIYKRNDHFDAEALFIDLKQQKFRISRATVYNTLELLEACELIKRHQFGSNIARYEKSYGYKQHDHLVCTKCGKVEEFCDPRIQQIQSMMGELLKFKVTHHSLNLYGICNNCQQNNGNS